MTSTPTGRRRAITTTLLLSGTAIVIAAFVAAYALKRIQANEVDLLASTLRLQPGMTVADVGAGTGWLAIEVAKQLPTGRVIATELNTARMEEIRRATDAAGVRNVTIVPAAERAANLPAECCHAIYMRRVYHHLSDRRAVLSDIRTALNSGGRLVVVEFEPGELLSRLTGMSTESKELVDTAAAAGFSLVEVIDWPVWGHYAAVFEGSPLPSVGSKQ